MTGRRLRLAVAVTAVVATAVVALVLLAGGAGDGALPSAPGASFGDNGLEGGELVVPGELSGVVGATLTVEKGREYTIESWRLRRVVPRDTRVVYRVRRSDAYGGTDCPGSGLSFGSDGPTARRAGEVFPCRLERPGTQRVVAGRGWELVAVFWASRTPGAVMRVSHPEAIVRDRHGRRFRVTDVGFDQSSCVMGGKACARWLARKGGFEKGEAVHSVKLICRLPRRPPLFAAPADRPPAPQHVPRGRDASGRPCTRPGR